MWERIKTYTYSVFLYHGQNKEKGNTSTIWPNEGDDSGLDYYTKPLQGALFRKFRDLVLGIEDVDLHKYRNEYKATIKQFGLDTATS